MDKLLRIGNAKEGGKKLLQVGALALMSGCASIPEGQQLAINNLEVRGQLEQLGVTNNSACREYYETGWKDVNRFLDDDDRAGYMEDMKNMALDSLGIISDDTQPNGERGALGDREMRDRVEDFVEKHIDFIKTELELLESLPPEEITTLLKTRPEVQARCLKALGYNSERFSDM